jgi:hypothetical protein
MVGHHQETRIEVNNMDKVSIGNVIWHIENNRHVLGDRNVLEEVLKVVTNRLTNLATYIRDHINRQDDKTTLDAVLNALKVQYNMR